ncbi:hypothetical protein CPB83DRAFT_860062 [Crepidotus variabilis]|uniref:Steroid 5-alpha reductase C-terminal domain-containing protein n=1 Tax=Crepidotus variabilis TaxID=179855 RepID=A0A9P6JLE8_9AGAR|nr:hypothetical protein CPB83DRAFT_860062 [Crepidotus variabilis]
MSQRNLVQRGKKHSSPLGSTLFIALRSLDPVIQYGILAHGVGGSLLGRVGLQVIPNGPPIQTGIGFIDALQLSPYRLLLLAMSTGSVLKHFFWLLYTSKEAVSISAAVGISMGNVTGNAMINLIATTTLASSLPVSPTITQPTVIIGGVLYLVGFLTEVFAEVQRKLFKDDPKNEGKACTSGFWSITRHINYTGYVLWKTGHFLAGGGLTVATIGGFLVAKDFVDRAIPELDAYASKRYGTQWESYKRKTYYKLIPGII